MASCTEFDVLRPRKKARRSCLYCQKAHKTCGNERPCGQCVKRKVPSQCVDGHRKPPKYLNENTKKRGKAALDRGFTSMQQSQYQQEIILETTRYDSESAQQEYNDEEQIRDYRRDPFEEFFDELIDSNFFYTQRPSFKFGNQGSGGTIVKGNGDFTPFFSNAEYSTWSERSSSVSEDSEAEASYQALDDGVRASLAKLHKNTREELYSGFAISSGWSSTFFPHGMEE
ncbi:hypothetical protein N7447_003336 [Penicillium robsamsonii]|uniref:uncharacterized protein n=1 Tax=Penicillium robsamsonii TaxID=1792511 RepID=UPI0025498190|nr:uncharacterized protein N7447_003336 [Penicillium robsamsonii]KAJ5826573.1 hypothetical protein N7447_003336 [Penicillium robsamsonii]